MLPSQSARDGICAGADGGESTATEDEEDADGIGKVV